MKSSARPSHSMTRQFVRDYLLVSLVPILLLVAFIASGAWVAKTYLDGLIQDSLGDLNRSAELHLEQLGQSIIRSKAQDVAQQVAIYLESHPNVPMQHLQATPEFKRVALQDVGKTGYTCLYEAGTGIMRFHPNEKLIDRKMDFLAESLPSWWRIFQPTLAGTEHSGYYDWLEPDGSVRRKYMTMTPVSRPHLGKTLMIAATTYIDEFSSPAAAMKNQAQGITSNYQSYVSNRAFQVAGGTFLVLLFALAVVYVSGRRAARRYILPIEGLANAAKELAKGEWDPNVDAGMLGRNDEIGVLAREFSDMRTQLKKAFHSLEERYTELRQMQEALKESEAHFRNLFDSVPVGLYRSTPEGKITDVNPTLVAMLGYPDRETFLSKDASELYIRQEDRLTWRQRVEGKSGHDRTEVKMRRHTGEAIWVVDYSRAIRDADGRVVCYEGSLNDVTERKKAEQGLRESEENYRRLYRETKQAEEVYRSLLNSSADAIAIYDLEGRTQYISPAFTSLFEWTLEELANKRIPFVPESEKEATGELTQDLLQHGTPSHGFETKRYTKSGKVVDVSISASRYDDSTGNPAG
ncbi:MAG: PAS domain S-box protein, partial [Desulfobacteraceae bacterium]